MAQDVEYLTSTEAARLLHVSPKTVSRWATEGRIPCIVTLGGHRRFHPDNVAAVAEMMSQGAPPEPEP
ncbi:MAG: helix-turn-helix domain-containing protein [Acidimicrobiales bacterium]